MITKSKAIILVFLLSMLTMLFPGQALANITEWDSVNGGGGESTGGGNTLQGSINQVTTGLSNDGGSDYVWQGYQISIPQQVSVSCEINSAACVTGTCYGASDGDFTFTNTSGCGAPPCSFHQGATQYYQYLWQTTNSYTHASIQGGNSWGDSDVRCPGGSCDALGATIDITPASTSNTWYFVVRSFNGGQDGGDPGDDGLIGGDAVLGPYLYDLSAPSITGTVTPSNNDYSSSYVDGEFDIDLSGITDVGCAGSITCQYCVTSDGACNTEWAAATFSSGDCSYNSATCTDGDSLTIQMRASDGRGNTTTAPSVSRTCDASPPIVTQVLPTADVMQNSTTINSGDVTCNDIYSGIDDSTPYDVQWCNDGAAKDTCNAGGTWADTSPAGWSGTNDETFTGSGGNWYRFRARCIDNVGNISGWTYSTGYYMLDTQAPNNVASVNAWDSSGKNVALVDSAPYSYDDTTPGPYFEWTDPTDNPASPNSGVAGFYVYFGSDSGADPSAYQAKAGTNTYTNSSSLTPGTFYYLRIKTVDNVGNVSAAATLFTYKYSSGAYLQVTTSDDDNTSYGGDLGKVDGASNDSSIKKIEGILTPDNTDFEIVSIFLYNELDELVGGAAGSRSITVSLEGVTTSGAYISATSLTGATTGGTSITGNMSNSQGWIKVKATAAQTTAVYVSATVNGGDALSGSGGRSQKAPITIGSETAPGDGLSGEIMASLDIPITGGTVMHPVWSHNGKQIVYAARKTFPNDWNLYKMSYSFGTVWSGPTRLTKTEMCMQPQSKYSFSADDSKVLFSARPSCTANSVVEMYAVDAGGADSSKTLATLESENKLISNGDSYWWWDVDWNSSTCGSNADRMLVSLADMSALGDVELYMVYGLKNSAGLYTETGTGFAPIQVTDIGGGNVWNMQGAWSSDCSKIVFTSWEGSGNPKTGIYMINLSAATLPITSLSDTGVSKIHECSTTSCDNGAALYPSFSSDGSMVSYMAGDNTGFDLIELIRTGSTQGGNLVTNFFTGANFDNYLEYILDQPTYAPQLIGMSSNNEFGLVQCSGTSCPYTTYGKPFAYITLNPGQTDGALKIITLGNTSTISANGGLLFYQGAVAAVFPAGSVVDPDLEITVEAAAPTLPPGGADSQDDMLVNIGESREFFPDGVVFDTDIQLVFKYCDRDDNGFMDVDQTSGCPGVVTGGDGYDEDKLYVYYWCESASLGCTADSWEKLDGSIDAANNTITVATNHFSRYDMFALNRGRNAPQTFVPLSLNNLHTFPNPWRTGQGNITFFADSTSTFNTGNAITVEIQIFDMRGKLVRTINTVHGDNTMIPQSIDAGAAGGYEIATWDVKDNSGNQVASNVLLYLLRVNDGIMSRKYTGKLAVVR